jgi:hypothetical protein
LVDQSRDDAMDIRALASGDRVRAVLRDLFFGGVQERLAKLPDPNAPPCDSE